MGNTRSIRTLLSVAMLASLTFGGVVAADNASF
jgi:hypothetical protein